MLEDRLLIHRFNRGDHGAFQRIYEKYRSDLLKVAYVLLHDKAVLEDVLHDVFVGFAQCAGHFQLKGSLRGYLAVCVANRARDVNRAGTRQQGQPRDEADTSLLRDKGPADSVIRGELMDQLTQALGQLPFEQQETIVLHLQNQMQFKEIARLKTLSVNTVMSRYRYGLEKLRSMLDGVL